MSESVTVCIAAQRVIFLDVARDRYFTLSPGLNAACATWLGGAGRGELPSALATALGDLGIVACECVARLRPMPCHVGVPAAYDAERLPSSPAGLSRVLRVALAVVSAWADVRARPLGAILARRLGHGSFQAMPGEADLFARLGSFRLMRPYIPVPRVCLHDCLALLDWLGPARERTQLVFGVCAYPFAAHCWIQAGGRVIDDHPESVSRFEPILHFG